MRNTSFILLFAIMVLIGCKPKSKSSLEIKSDSTKSNNGFTMPDVGDLKNNSNSSGSWSQAYRSKFVQDCITKASESVGQADATSYCNCMVVKVEAKYPNENLVDASLTSADITTMRVGCAPNTSTQSNQSNQSYNNSGGGSWSMTDQREFMANCTPGASTSLGTSGANDYCDCMLKKLMQAYPNSADVGNVSKEQMSTLAQDCIRR